MSKNIRRGRTGTVICASCGQVVRRDRAVYRYKDGIKVYYCPDCAKKIHNSKLYKGAPRFVEKHEANTLRRKFIIYQTEEQAQEVKTEQATETKTDEQQKTEEQKV